MDKSENNEEIADVEIKGSINTLENTEDKIATEVYQKTIAIEDVDQKDVNMEIFDIKEMPVDEVMESIIKDDEPCQDTEDIPQKDESMLVEPLYNKNIIHFSNKTCMELSRCSWHSQTNQNYLKGCLFSPDGSCILSAVNGDGMHVFELPSDLYTIEIVPAERPVDLLTSVIHIKEAGNLYDMVWFPYMNSSAPETCCWLATRQHEPIQMWDAFNGTLRCSYRGYDNVDELEPALSIAFSYDGEQIFAGYKKSIKIFNTNKPGRDYQKFPTKSTASCIATNYIETSLIAIGSWNRSISILDMNSGETMPVGNGKSQEKYHRSGVTHLKFTHNGEILISGARKDDKLLFWDLRNLSQPVHRLNRKVDTNQRVFFDLSSDGEWLVSGDTNGVIHAWNTSDSYKELQLPVHNDCCNGVSFHPNNRPIIATTSGMHHFETSNEDTVENSLNIWWTGEHISVEE